MKHRGVKNACRAILAIILAGSVMAGKAQDSVQLKKRAFQAGFVTPLGTNGLDSWNITNGFSLNILAGYAGGVDGLELSGLGSVIRKDMKGAQFAGLGTVVLGGVKGAQFSGLYNIAALNVAGAQFAGLVNINASAFRGFQTAGILNMNAGLSEGFQVAGLANYSRGGRISQVGGLSNITSDTTRGLQLAGLANVASGRLSGTQIAGLFNYAGRLKGVQVGVFNYVDSLESGVPIGFISVVRNGYFVVEAGVTETLFGVVSVKTGTKKFYNILSAGGGTRNSVSLFAWGYGLGAFFPLGEKTGLSIDGTCYQVNEGEWFTDRMNLLNRLSVTASFSLGKHLSLFGGLSWNVTVSDCTDEYGDKVQVHIAPWKVFEETYDDHILVTMYPGISAGIRL